MHLDDDMALIFFIKARAIDKWAVAVVTIYDIGVAAHGGGTAIAALGTTTVAALRAKVSTG